MFHKITGLRPEDFHHHISDINDKLRSLAMEIRKAVAEDDGVMYHALVNTRQDDTVNAATELNFAQLTFFKKVLEKIVVGDTMGYIRGLDANNLGKSCEPPMSFTKSEEIVENLIKSKWLAKVDEGITLGVRSMLELRPYIELFYGESLPDCVLCSEAVLRGTSCSSDRCGTKMHVHCQEKWFHGNKDKKCPTCTLPWGG